MNEKFKSFINISSKIGLKVVACICLIIGILSIFITAYFNSTFFHEAENTLFKYTPNIIAVILVLFFSFVVSQNFLRKFCKKRFILPILLGIVSIISIGLYTYWILAIRLNPETDQKMIHDMAVGLLTNNNLDYYLQTSQYLFLYPYQLGFTYVVAFIYKIFNSQNFLILEFINEACSILNAILLTLIGINIFKNKNVRISLVLLCGLFIPYWMFFNVHFYGNIMGLTFALLSVLFCLKYLNKNKLIYLLLCGASISFSIICKSNYNIFLCGIILTLIIDFINKKIDLNLVKALCLFLIGYSIFSIGYKTLTVNVYKMNLPKGVPMISFVYMGLSETDDKACGWYNSKTVDLFREYNYDYDRTNNAAKSLVAERLGTLAKDPIYGIKFFSNKLASTWLNPTFQTVWCSLPGTRYRMYEDYAHFLGYHETALSMLDGNIYKLEEIYFDSIEILVFTFSAISLFAISKKIDTKRLLIPIIFIGGFIFHLFWETKAIYVIQYYYLLLPYAAYGINLCYLKLKRLKKVKSK